MSGAPITVGVWSKRRGVGAGWGKVSEIRTWRDLSLEPRFMQPGPWSIRLPYDTQTSRLGHANLLTFDYRGNRMTAIIDKVGPQSDDTGRPMVEASGVDALALLGDVLCWPVPASALSTQAEAYYKATGPAETVLRNLMVANFARRGDDVVVPPSQGRGASVSLNERFSSLLPVVTAKAELAGLGVRMGLVNTTSSTRAQMQVDFFTPVDKSNRVRLSHKVGTLRSWKQEDNAPTATRVIVAGGGQGALRLFRQVTSAAAETEWGRKREVFQDARDTTSVALLDERGAETLLEAAAQSAFELEAAEAEGMRYGVHFNLGDMVTIELLDEVAAVDRLRAVKLTATGDSGLTVELVPGNPDALNPMFAQAVITRGVRRQVQALERRDS